MLLLLLLFFFNDTATTEIYTLSLHDALPIYRARRRHRRPAGASRRPDPGDRGRGLQHPAYRGPVLGGPQGIRVGFARDLRPEAPREDRQPPEGGVGSAGSDPAIQRTEGGGERLRLLALRHRAPDRR